MDEHIAGLGCRHRQTCMAGIGLEGDLKRFSHFPTNLFCDEPEGAHRWLTRAWQLWKDSFQGDVYYLQKKNPNKIYS